MLEGLNTDFFDAKGESPLANQWTCLHFGDYVAYYLGIAYGIHLNPGCSAPILQNRVEIDGIAHQMIAPIPIPSSAPAATSET